MKIIIGIMLLLLTSCGNGFSPKDSGCCGSKVKNDSTSVK
jgi:hypothetical protein